MQAICRLAGAIAALATMSSAGNVYSQETKQLPVPNVTVTAPAAPVEPPYLRNPWKSYQRNPYAGRYRVEEDKFTEVPCTATRIASSAGGKCLQGYRLVPGNVVLHQSGGLKCDMALDVVMYKVGNLSIEASTLIFGRVEDWRAGWGRNISTLPRFQPPPRRTQHADFPHCAPPFASRRGLLDLSCRGDFRSVASHSIAVEQP